jgi:hypothetical protein
MQATDTSLDQRAFKPRRSSQSSSPTAVQPRFSLTPQVLDAVPAFRTGHDGTQCENDDIQQIRGPSGLPPEHRASRQGSRPATAKIVHSKPSTAAVPRGGPFDYNPANDKWRMTR